MAVCHCLAQAKQCWRTAMSTASEKQWHTASIVYEQVEIGRPERFPAALFRFLEGRSRPSYFLSLWTASL